MPKRSGFTYSEIMIVIIILGIMATAALGTYRHMINRMKKQEAEQVLLSVFSAQMDHNGDYGSYSADIADLDISIPAMKHYKDLTVSDSGAVSCNGTGKTWVAGVTANDDSYDLFMTTDGKVVCDDCNSSACKLMGYSSNW